MRTALSFAALLVVVSAAATVFEPRTDRELIAHADAVVVGTILDAHARLRADGWVVTDYRLEVEESLKGNAAGIITITEFGGGVPGRLLVIPDSATFVPGERAILFLRHANDGSWFTESMALGRFRLTPAANGEMLAVRESDELHEAARLAAGFRSFIRSGGTLKSDYVTNLAPPKPLSNGPGLYCLTGTVNSVTYPVRWAKDPGNASCNTGCTIPFRINGTDATGSVPKALAAWTNDPVAWISLSNGGATTDNVAAADGQNVILFNSTQQGQVPVCDGALACTQGWGDGNTNVWGGDTFYNIVDADVILRSTITPSQMDAVLTHELGHAIGFRHSDAGQPFSATALMASTINVAIGANLLQWDKDAVDSVYGPGPVCQQPANVTTNPSGNANVASGQPVNITSSVGSGTAPFTYQWYAGSSGDTTTPVGSNASNYMTPPINTTSSYWLKVTNSCGSANSATVTLIPTVGCQQPAITTQPASANISEGGTAQLTVGVSGTPPLFYQWYQGQSGDTSKPISGATSQTYVTPQLIQPASYWVQVSNQCGTVNSATATVTIGNTCSPPVFTLQPSGTPLAPGQQTYLVAAASAALSYQWYKGTPPDTSSPQAGQPPSNQRYVSQLYIDLLHRAADAGASAIVSAIDSQALTRFGAASTVATSAEYRMNLIKADYNRYLHRDPSAAEVNFWLALLNGPSSEEELEAQILGSQEYFALAGGTNDKFLKQLYLDVENNSAPPSFNFNLLLSILNSNNSRTSLAELMLNDPAAKDLRLTGWFNAYLRRNPTAAELSQFELEIGTKGEDWLAQSLMLASDEYFNFPTVLFTGPVSNTTSFWVRAVNGACVNDSNAALIAILASCAPQIVVQPANQTIGIGASPTLTVNAAGNDLAYQWYQGNSGDTSKPLSGQTRSVLKDFEIGTPGTYSFWVRVTGSCGTADSATTTVTVACTSPPQLVVTLPPTVMSGNGYSATVTGATDVYAKFELQESTSADFSNATTTTSVVPTVQIPSHTVTTATIYYYRVRGFLACDNSISSPYSITSKTLVLTRIPLTPPPIFNVVTAPCQKPPCLIQVPFTINVPTITGKSALQSTSTFSVSSDKPWITFDQSSGPLPPEGATVTATLDSSAFDIGSTEATISVTRNTTTQSAGDPSAQSTTTTTGNTPVSVSLVSGVTPLPKDSNVPANTLLIPAIAHADGFGGSHFQSDIRLTNTASQSISYQLTFTPSNSDGTTTGKSTTINVAGGATVALNDVVMNFFGSGVAGEPGAGTLEIRPLNYAGKGPTSTNTATTPVNVQFVTVASSRTYNSTSTGTYGQFIPALAIANFLTKSDTSKISLQQVADSKSFRTNIGFAEGGGQAADLVVTLLDANGGQIAQRVLHLLPFQQTQSSLSSFFNVAGGSIPEGRVEVVVTSDTGRVTSYASVLDNATSDPLLVFPTDPSKISSSRYVVPGVADLAGAAGSNFHTDMRIYNAGSAAATVTLAYVPQGDTPPPSPAPVTLTIDPGAEKAIDNVLPTLWNLTGTGGAVVGTTASASQLVFTARTYSRNATGGTYGQFIPGVTASDAVGVNERSLNVVQLEQSPQYRSNVGLVEVTGNSATVEIRGYAPDAKTVAVATRTLNAGEFIQLNAILASLGFSDVYDGRVAIRVIDGSGRVASYGSIIDNRTQDPTYVPAQ